MRELDFYSQFVYRDVMVSAIYDAAKNHNRGLIIKQLRQGADIFHKYQGLLNCVDIYPEIANILMSIVFRNGVIDLELILNTPVRMFDMLLKNGLDHRDLLMQLIGAYGYGVVGVGVREKILLLYRFGAKTDQLSRSEQMMIATWAEYS